MSWNGTLTCSYCYGTGHSRRKCPDMKEKHDKYESATEEERRDMSYRYRNAHNEWGRMRETLKESNKVCTFCQTSGHRVLTCPDRLGKVDMLKKINKVYKPLLRKTLKEIGFGKGCLVESWEWVTIDGKHEKRQVPYMVTDIEQGALDFCNLREGFGTITVTSMIDMRQRGFGMPQGVKWAVTQAVCHLDDYGWGESPWCPVGKLHPFQSTVRNIGSKLNCDKYHILAPSDDLFPEERLHHPLEKKRDINKMFRETKKRSDEGKFYTEEYTHNFVGEMFSKLKEHKGWKL